MPKKQQKVADDSYKKLTDYINQLAGGVVDWVYTTARLKQFVKQGMTYEGMRYALWYQTIVRSIPYDGIDLIPYMYDKAKTYWNEMQRIKGQIVNADFAKNEIAIEVRQKEEDGEIFK